MLFAGIILSLATSMNRQMTQKEAIFQYCKMFLAQYLSSVHGYCSFQEEALIMLTHFLMQIIRRLAVKCKSLVNMQGRTIPNSLHLLVVLDQMKTLNFEDLLSFILKRKQLSMDLKSLDVIERVGRKLFENDVESVNNYEKEKQHANIRYIPSVYRVNISKEALPYRHPIDEAFPLPSRLTYEQTPAKIQPSKDSVETLAMYTKRQMIRALSAKMTPKEQQQKQERAEDYGSAPEKRRKFHLIEYFS